MLPFTVEHYQYVAFEGVKLDGVLDDIEQDQLIVLPVKVDLDVNLVGPGNIHA